MLDPQKTLHTSPWRASYGVSFVNICGKTDRVITAPHCITYRTSITKAEYRQEFDLSRPLYPTFTASVGCIFLSTWVSYNASFMTSFKNLAVRYQRLVCVCVGWGGVGGGDGNIYLSGYINLVLWTVVICANIANIVQGLQACNSALCVWFLFKIYIQIPILIYFLNSVQSFPP